MNKKNFLKYGIPLIFGVIILILFYLIRNILMPFILSIIFSYVVNPLITKFEARGYRRDITIIILYLTVLSVISITLFFTTPFILNGVKKFKSDLPVIEKKIEFFIDKNSVSLEKLIKYNGKIPLKDIVKPKVNKIIREQIEKTPQYIPQIINIFSYFFLIPFISFFILLSSRKIVREIIDSMPPDYVETILSIICEIDEVLGNFMRGQIIDSACVATLSIIGLWYLKIDYFFLLGPMAGIGNMVPYLGPVVGAIPSAIIGIFKFNSIIIVIKVIIMFIIVQFIDNWFISPIAVGKSVSLNALEMLIFLMVGAELFGAIGVLLAVPVGASLKITLQILYLRYKETFQGKKTVILELKTKDLI